MKHLLYLLLLIFLAACTEHSDIIPDIDKDKAYYEDWKAEVSWKSSVHQIEDAYSGHTSDAVIIDDFIYTLSVQPNKLYCVDLETGEKQWEFEFLIPPNERKVYSFEIIREGNTLYLLNNWSGEVYLISQSEGQLLESRNLNDFDFYMDPDFTPVRSDHLVYFLGRLGNSKSIIRYNLLDHSFETVTSFDHIENEKHTSLGVLSEDGEQIFFIIDHIKQGTRKKSLYSVDLMNNSHQLVWEADSLISYTEEITYLNGDIIFAPTRSELISVNSMSGDLNWAKSNLFSYWPDRVYAMGQQLIVSTNDRYYSLDPENGNPVWSRNFSGISTYTTILADQQIISGFTSDGLVPNLTHYDLQDGQKLANIPLSEDQNELGRFILYDPDSEDYYVGTNNSIYKFNQLLP